MAKVGLTNLYYAPVTANTDSAYTAGTPVRIAGAIEVNIEPETAEAKLYADNGLYASETAVTSITVTLGVADVPTAVQAALLGATVQVDKTLLVTANDRAQEVAIGFQSDTHDGGEELVWLFSGKFQLPSEDNKTKEESIEYTTPSLEGTFGIRKKDGALMTKARSKDEGISEDVIKQWFNAVPTPAAS